MRSSRTATDAVRAVAIRAITVAGVIAPAAAIRAVATTNPNGIDLRGALLSARRLFFEKAKIFSQNSLQTNAGNVIIHAYFDIEEGNP